MSRKIQIELEEEVFHQLKKLCNGNESSMQENIVQNIKKNFNQSNDKIASEKKDSLEDYLKKGRTGSRNYGVKGQGW